MILQHSNNNTDSDHLILVFLHKPRDREKKKEHMERVVSHENYKKKKKKKKNEKSLAKGIHDYCACMYLLRYLPRTIHSFSMLHAKAAGLQ